MVKLLLLGDELVQSFAYGSGLLNSDGWGQIGGSDLLRTVFQRIESDDATQSCVFGKKTANERRTWDKKGDFWLCQKMIAKTVILVRA